MSARMLAGGLCLVLAAGGVVMSSEVHVAPKGDDAGPGTAAAPFATIERAQEALRQAGGGTAVIHGGTYRLSAPLLFGPDDSNCTYVAAAGEKPIVSGGRSISGWKKDPNGVWTTTIDDVKAGTWWFRELFVGGRRCTRARHPNSGYLRVEKPGPDNRTSFTFKEGDLPPLAKAQEAELVFLHDWSISRVRLAAVDEAQRTVRLLHPVGPRGQAFWNITGFEPHPRYVIENALEFHDQAGEWYLDRQTGVLSYWPLPGEDLTRAEVVAPAVEPLLVVQGDGAKERFVEHLTFRGLAFEHCASLAQQVRYAGGQAGFHENQEMQGTRERMPAAVRFDAARHCAFADGRIAHVGGTAISLENFCRDNRIVGNEIADCGGNGLMVGEASKDPKRLAYRNRVENNRVHHCGQVYFGCVGIWAGITEGTMIVHNEVHDLPYTGISLGWQWNWEPTPAQNNRIEYNHIYRVMQILSDGGGIYTLGRQPGTVLRGNFIHSIPPNAGRAESNGMFLDEGTCEFLIEENTIYAVAKSPLRFHKAKGDTVARNVLVCARGVPPVRYNATDPATIALVENRVLQADEAAAFIQAAAAQAGPEAPYRERLVGDHPAD